MNVIEKFNDKGFLVHTVQLKHLDKLLPKSESKISWSVAQKEIPPSFHMMDSSTMLRRIVGIIADPDLISCEKYLLMDSKDAFTNGHLNCSSPYETEEERKSAYEKILSELKDKTKDGKMNEWSEICTNGYPSEAFLGLLFKGDEKDWEDLLAQLKQCSYKGTIKVYTIDKIDPTTSCCHLRGTITH